MPAPDQSDYIAPLREIVEFHVVPLIGWYQHKKRWPRRIHKLSSATVIVLGTSIPIASIWSNVTYVRALVGLIGVAITAITSLTVSHAWYHRWQIFATTQNRLESHLATWELALTQSQMKPVDEGRDEALAATAALIEAANHARNEETQSFFKSQRDSSKVSSTLLKE